MTTELNSQAGLDPELTELVLSASRRLAEHARVGEEASDLDGLGRAISKTLDAVLFFSMSVADGHSAPPALVVAVEQLYDLILGIQRGLLVHELELASLYSDPLAGSVAQVEQVTLLRARAAYAVRELHGALLTAYAALFDQAIDS